MISREREKAAAFAKHALSWTLDVLAMVAAAYLIRLFIL